MTRAEYQALCVIGSIAVIALLKVMQLERRLNAPVILYKPPSQVSA